jgi:hypothetical protein
MHEAIERVCTTPERDLLAPHVERLMEAMRMVDQAAMMLEPRMISEGWKFDPDRFAWIREASITPEPE